MILTPENIKYQAASNIRLIACSYLASLAGAVLHVSNVNGFSDGNAIRIQPKNGSPSFLQLASSNAVDKKNKTLTLSGVPTENAGVNEVQTATGGTGVAGNVALSFKSYSTPAFAASATASTVQALLEALTTIGVGNILVTGGPLNTATPMVFTFRGALAKSNQTLMIVNNAAVTGGPITIVETTPGTSYSPLPSADSTIIGPSMIELGGTTGGLQFDAKPENVPIEYDQRRAHVAVVQTHYDADIKGTLMEFDAAQWGVLTQQGYRLRTAGTGVNGATIVDALGRQMQYGAQFFFNKQDPTDPLHDILLAYQVASMDGISTAFDKRNPTNLPFTFHCLSDPGRPDGADLYEIIQETAPAT